MQSKTRAGLDVCGELAKERSAVRVDAQALWASGDLVSQGWPGSLAGQTQWACCPLRSGSVRAEGRHFDWVKRGVRNPNANYNEL